MAKRTCVIPECGKFVHGHGWCFKHYQRWRAHGDPLALLPSYDECQVEGCAKPLRSKRSGLCEMHYVRRYRHGDPNAVMDTRKPLVLYRAAHARIQRDRGFARDYMCVDCNRPADDWSYDHSDPDELVSQGGQPYSLDIMCYEPRCTPCHAVFDGVGRNQYSAQRQDCTHEAWRLE